VSRAPREAAEVFDWGAFLGVLPWTVLAVVVVLGVTLAVALGQGRHTVVDVAWGLGFVAIAVAAFLAGDGDPGRSWLVLALTAGWGLRLGAHIHRRSRGRGEDPRYEELLAKAPPGGRTAFAVRRIYLTQGVVMWFVSLPVQVAMVQPQGLGALAWAGAAVWAVGLFFETVGDWQLERFRAEPSNRGRVLDTGLWHYTRHPNYFGDACVWWGLWLVAASAWPGVLFVLSPLAMTWNLAKGTGAALLEKDIADRRPDYADYVRRTSGFVPLPPRKPQRRGTPS
jgi:steroid 5-alpha reductase family enzyme